MRPARSDHGLRLYAEVLVVDPVKFGLARRGYLVRGGCKVHRVLVHQLVLYLLRVLLRQRHIPILVVQAHLSQRLEVHVRTLSTLLLISIVISIVDTYFDR